MHGLEELGNPLLQSLELTEFLLLVSEEMSCVHLLQSNYRSDYPLRWIRKRLKKASNKFCLKIHLTVLLSRLIKLLLCQAGILMRLHHISKKFLKMLPKNSSDTKLDIAGREEVFPLSISIKKLGHKLTLL